MEYLANYSAPPAEGWRTTDLIELTTIYDMIEETVKIADTQNFESWQADAASTDLRACAGAISALGCGKTVLIARDDDGLYFAVQETTPSVKRWKVLIDGDQRFGSGGYMAGVSDLKGSVPVAGVPEIVERTQFVAKAYACYEGPEPPVSWWTDVPRRGKRIFVTSEAWPYVRRQDARGIEVTS